MGRLDSYLSACQPGITLASLGLGWAGEPLVAKMIEPAFKALSVPDDKPHSGASRIPLGRSRLTVLESEPTHVVRVLVEVLLSGDDDADADTD